MKGEIYLQDCVQLDLYFHREKYVNSSLCGNSFQFKESELEKGREVFNHLIILLFSFV